MAARDIGMGSQPAFQIIAADFAEERIVRVLRHAARLRGKVRRQRKQRNRRVVTRSEEKRDGQAVRPLRRRHHAMDVGAQIAVGGHFENLADVDDEASRDGRRVDPAAVVGLNLQAGLLLLQEKGHEARILVGAHALIALVRRAAGVADDLDERVRRRRVDRRENVFGLLKRGGERAQHLYGERGGLILIGEKRPLKLRERAPAIGSDPAGASHGGASRSKGSAGLSGPMSTCSRQSGLPRVCSKPARL